MAGLPRTLTAPVGRLGAAAQNALEVARFGGLATGEEPAPFDVVDEHRVYRLRHYYAGTRNPGPPVLLVPPMMLAAEVYDVSPQTSAVTLLRENGADPWVVDFGSPDKEEGGLERTLADHVIAVSDAVERVKQETGKDVNLSGYSQGGMFCYQAAAYRRNHGLASLVTFGSPVDTGAAMPLGIPRELGSGLAGMLAATVFRGTVALPAWASRNGFRLLDPVKSMRSRIDFILSLHDREALLPREGQRRFLEADGWVAWPGPAMADFLRQFIAHNRMLEGGFVIDDKLLTLADIALPILSVVGTVDEIAPPPGVRAIRLAAPRADVYELALDAGHFGLVVGSKAVRITWPTVAAWAKWQAGGKGDPPAGVTEVPDDDVPTDLVPHVRNRMTYGVELAGAVSTGIARSLAVTAERTAASVRELARETASQLPRLARLETIQPGTRVSLGLLLDERRRRAPDEMLFLFEDRAYTGREVNERIDNVVRGLIEIGVHQGEHIGVLMGPRPTSLALTAAINRLGAVAVLLRPDGDIAREARMAQVGRIIADPERAELAADIGRVHRFVLGGGGGPRELGVPLTTDMEQIDPDAVPLPKWYTPNPGRASDVAFVLFTGEGETMRMSRITNRRWAMSAYGVASAAAMSEADTVYNVTPLYHASALLMSVGGAIAGGARLALGTKFDPSTFWEETRRYGVTIATYTWTSLHDLVEAPAQPGERHHAVRLFIGAGMPRGLWQRVQRRFAPARVLEFYAATETGAILINVSGSKVGSMGRPLPGSAEVRIAAYNPQKRELVLRRDGYVRRCDTGEVGMLLARSQRDASTGPAPLRSVFSRDDAWVATGDLFRVDADGDYWRVDNASDIVATKDGPAFTVPIRDALAGIAAVDLSVAYNVRPEGASADIAVAAVTVRGDRKLDAREIGRALDALPPHGRPSIIRVLDEIPVTTWYRPIVARLRAEGIPEPDPDHDIWAIDEARERYRPLSATARKRLLRSVA